MAGWLIIRPDAGDPSSGQWAATGHAPQQGPLEEAAAWQRGRRVVWAAPATEVLVTRVELPPTAGRRLRQAVPYALEDRLLGEVESLHFAIGARRHDGNTPVAVVERARMHAWLEAQREAGLQVEFVLPEPLLLPLEPNEWNLCCDRRSCWLRTGPVSGFGFDPGELAPALAAALAEAGPEQPARIRFFGAEAAGTQARQVLPTEVSWQREGDARRALSSAAEKGAPDTGLNLLQGEFSRAQRAGRIWRPWRGAAALAGAWIVLELASSALEVHQLEQRSQELDQRIAQTFHRALPDVERMVNPKVQLQQELAATRGVQNDTEAEFLDLLLRAGDIFHHREDVRIMAVRYDQGRLDVEVETGEVRSLDAIKQALQQAGLEVEIQSATAGREGVAGRLRITGSAS